MRLFLKKICTLFLAMICILPFCLPYSAFAAESNIQTKLNTILNEYPNGSYFSVNGQRCEHSQTSTCYNCSFSGILTAKGERMQDSGRDCNTCWAFARYVQYRLYGWDSLYIRSSVHPNGLKSISSGATSEKSTFSSAKIGDVIWFYSQSSCSGNPGHMGIFMGADSNGIWLYDNNIHGSKTYTGTVRYANIAYKDMPASTRNYCKIYRAGNYENIVGGSKNDAHQCTITFDPNGGSVSPTTMTLTTGMLLTGMPTPIRDGYRFLGWAMDKIDPNGGGAQVTTIVSDSVFTFDKDTTLYAHWAQDNHTHTNGAYFYSDNHPHYKFYTCTTCGEVYTDGSTTNMSSCSVCNPQKDEPIHTYTVTFDPSGGECNVGTMKTNAEGKLSSLPIPTRSNCTFEGWRMIVGGSERWRDVDTNTIFTKDTKVYASWIYGPCTVFFDANGGTVSQGSKIVTAGTVYGDLPTPTRNGYTFDGWYTKASGGIRMTSNTGVEATADHTLYAHWSANPTQTTWGAWSAWSTTPYNASSTRQVETQQVKVSDAYTEYRYGLWRNTNNASWCPNYGASLSSSGGSWYESYSSWSKTRMYRDTGHNAFCAGGNHNHTHVAGYDSSGQAYWDIYSDDGTFTGWGRLYYYWEETRTIPAVYQTQYRYRDLISA